jgi:pentatricopeptide repeat protein
MKHDQVKPDLTSWSAALYCYAQRGQTQKAEGILQRMIDERTAGNDSDDHAIGLSVQNILLAYREAVTSCSLTDKKKEQALECAEMLFQKLKQADILDADSYGTRLRPLRHALLVLKFKLLTFHCFAYRRESGEYPDGHICSLW